MLSRAADTTRADIDALELVRAGDSGAMLDLYDRHAAILFGIALHVLDDDGMAADVLEEVLIRVWSGHERYDAALGTPRSWLCGLVRHAALDYRRARTARGERGQPGDERVPPRLALANETQGRVSAALEALPARQRDLIECAFFSGCSQDELAARFALSPDVVRTEVRRGMLALKETLIPGITHERGRT